MAKTKAELEAEIEELREQIAEKEAEAVDAGKTDDCDKAAEDIRRMYESYVKAGFSEEQAWELTITIAKNVTAPKPALFGR